MTQTTTTVSSYGVVPTTPPGQITRVTDDAILVKVWSTPIACTDNSTFSAAPAANGAIGVQFSADGVNYVDAAATPYTTAFSGGIPPTALWVRATAVGGTGQLSVDTPVAWVELTASQVAAVAAQSAYGFSGPTFFDPARPNNGRGKLICSWQVNPLQSGVTGTAYEAAGVFPEPATYPQALRPIVYQAYANLGQCRATAELGDDAATTAAAFTPTLTPAAVAANTTAEQSFTCTGITTAHRILNVNKAAQQVGLQIVAFKCDAADTLKITYTNTTGSSITPTAAEVYTVSTLLATGGQSSLFNSICIWVKGPVRADAQPYTYMRLDFGSDTAFINRALVGFAVRADGKWRPYILTSQQFGVAGSFAMGATRFDYVRLTEQGAATALTLTGAPALGDVSATLTGAFGGTTEVYPVRFSNNDVRLVQLTNGATTATWSQPLSAAATTAIVYATTLLGQQATEAVQVGPIYRDPAGKAFAYVRFDDCLIDQYVARQTLSTSFVGQSGITLATGAYSAKDVVSAFGLKANLFILTGCVGKANGSFMSVAQMRDLQDTYGWDVCFQTHANPASLNNLGARLLGPFGYSWSKNTGTSIASVDTTADTITTTAAHQMLTPATGNAGLQAQPIMMTGAALPAPLDTATVYWPRPTTTAAFQLHPTEADAAANTNRIDLTTTGTPASFGYRYSGSAADSSAILADFRAGQALMKSWGFAGWRYYASNQGGVDYATVQAMMTLRAGDELRLYLGTQGNTGATSSGYVARAGWGYTAAGYGFVGGGQIGTPMGDACTFPTGFATESSTEQAARDYIDSLVLRGAVGGNYHHFFSTEATLRALCAYCDQIALRRNQGLLLTGTMSDLWAYTSNSGVS